MSTCDVGVAAGVGLGATAPPAGGIGTDVQPMSHTAIASHVVSLSATADWDAPALRSGFLDRISEPEMHTIKLATYGISRKCSITKMKENCRARSATNLAYLLTPYQGQVR